MQRVKLCLNKFTAGVGKMMRIIKSQWLQILLWGSLLLFLWLGSAYFIAEILSRKPAPNSLPPNLGDLTITLFGASSIGIIAFGLLFTIAAIIEWQSLKKDTRREAEMAEVAERRITHLEKELRGRMHAVTGVALGSLHSNPLVEKQDPINRDYISEALYYSKQAYKTLKEIEGDSKYMALNNVLYFSCFLGNESQRDTFLAQARELKNIAEKYEESQYIAPYIMTYCRVMLTFGAEADREELKLALKKAESLLEMKLTILQRKEAEMLEAALGRKLDVLGKGD